MRQSLLLYIESNYTGGINHQHTLTAATLFTKSAEMTNTEDKSVKANQTQATSQAAIGATDVAAIDADKQHPAADKDNNTGCNPNDTAPRQTEHGGPKGLEPTRYGDWERNGRCTDF